MYTPTGGDPAYLHAPTTQAARWRLALLPDLDVGDLTWIDLDVTWTCHLTSDLDLTGLACTRLHETRLDPAESSGQRRSGISEMRDVISEMRGGLSEMRDGISETRDGVSEMASDRRAAAASSMSSRGTTYLPVPTLPDLPTYLLAYLPTAVASSTSTCMSRRGTSPAVRLCAALKLITRASS